MSIRLDINLFQRELSEETKHALTQNEEVTQSAPKQVTSSIKNEVLSTIQQKTIHGGAIQLDLLNMFGMSPAPTQSQKVKGNNRRGMKRTNPNSQTVFNPGVFQPRRQLENFEPRPFEGEILSFYGDGTLIEDSGQLGYLRDFNKKVPDFHPLKINHKQKGVLHSYIKVRDAYEALYSSEAQNNAEDKQKRLLLDKHYDAFVQRHGNLNNVSNLKPIKMDRGALTVLALERFVDGQAEKADIFHTPVSFSLIGEQENLNPEEALSLSLNRTGKVDMDFMVQCTGVEAEELKGQLQGRIYFNPIENEYEIADKFLAGNVVHKAGLLKQYLSNNDGGYAAIDNREAMEAFRALQKTIPEQIPFEQLDFNLGERWIPTGIYGEFASYLFDTDVDVHYSASMDDFSVKANRYNAQINDKYCVRGESRSYNGLVLMKHALVNTTPNISKRIMLGDKEVKVPDNEAIQMANSKIDEIRNGFSEWLYEQNPEFKNRLTQLYNNKFNCFVCPDYDGSHQAFPGLNLKNLGIDDLYGSQKDAVWMLKQNNGGICDHEVGAGKTLIMCCGAYEMKRLGIARKPMIIGLKANVHEIAHTFRAAYPHAKILYPGKQDFTPQKRLKIFHDIKNNNWDAIILTHDQFQKIPQSPEVQEKILQAELDSVEENLDVIRNQGGSVSNAMLKGLLKRKANLEVKLQGIAHQIEQRTDDIIDFKGMGIDHLFVDESHKFKNLMFNTRHDRVAGLGSSQGSIRALNLLFAIRTIQERNDKDLGLLFCPVQPSAIRLRNCTCFLSIYAQRHWPNRISIVLMPGPPFMQKRPPILNFR